MAYPPAFYRLLTRLFVDKARKLQESGLPFSTFRGRRFFLTRPIGNLLKGVAQLLTLCAPELLRAKSFEDLSARFLLSAR